MRSIALACATVRFTKRWRSSSLLFFFTPQRSSSSLFDDSLSCGPNIMSDGHHQRFTASCAMARCAGVPAARIVIISNPWRLWKFSSLQIRTIARAYGPYDALASIV